MNSASSHQLTEKEFNKDIKLEQALLDAQKHISILSHILGDYIYMDAPSNIYVCLCKRKKNVFFNVFVKNEKKIEKNIEIIDSILSHKPYSDEHLATKVFNIQLDEKDYFRFNVKVLLGTLKRQTNEIIINKSMNRYKKNELLIGLCLYFYEMLHDISSFLDVMYQWKMNRYKELEKEQLLDNEHRNFYQQYRPKSGMRNKLTSKGIYRASQYIVNRYIYRNDISVVPVAIFQLRQAIEMRLLEIFGIHIILKENGTPEKITANSFLEISDLEKNIIFPIKKSILIQIYTWTNIYVHLGIAGSYWLLEFAQYYMSEFILENSIVLKSYYEQIPNKISEYTGCKVEWMVKRKEINVDLIESEGEFYRVKNLIDTKGYKKYKDEKEMKFIELLKYNNETKDHKI